VNPEVVDGRSALARDPVAARLTQVPWGLAGCLVAGIVGTAGGWWWGGGTGAAGFAAGVVLVVTSYTFSSIVIAVADAIRPSLVLPCGLAAYVVKFSAFGVVMAAIADSGWPGLIPMGAGVVVSAVVWCATQIVWLVKTQHPYRRVEPR
jgi:hypothetical protein